MTRHSQWEARAIIYDDIKGGVGLGKFFPKGWTPLVPYVDDHSGRCTEQLSAHAAQLQSTYCPQSFLYESVKHAQMLPMIYLKEKTGGSVHSASVCSVTYKATDLQ